MTIFNGGKLLEDYLAMSNLFPNPLFYRLSLANNNEYGNRPWQTTAAGSRFYGGDTIHDCWKFDLA